MKALTYKRKVTTALAAFCLLNASTAALARDARLVSPPVAGAADPLTVRKAFKLDKDPLVSLVLRNEPVENILRGLANKANMNLVFMPGSSGTGEGAMAAPTASDPLLALEREIAGTSSVQASPGASSGSALIIPYLELKDIPVSEAFAIVMQISGLTGRRVYNSILIASPEKMTELGFATPLIKSYTLYNQIPPQVLKAMADISTVPPPPVAAAAPVAAAGGAITATPMSIPNQLGTIFSSRGIKPAPQMMLDMRTSTLTIIGTQEAIDIADQMIPILDKPLAQVSVEIKMIELTQRGSRELGMTYGFGQGKTGASFNNTDGAELGAGNPITADGGGVINFGALNRFAPNFNARLSALVRDAEARVLTNPRLTIQHGVTANFNSTTAFPIISTTATASAATQTVTTLNIGEQLEITPFIDETTGIVTMALKPSISTRGELVSVGGQTVPELNQRSVATILRVPNGETVIIGGLMRKADTKGVSKIPVLGDLPLIGGLFSTTQSTQEDVEIVIMVTPRILKDNR